MERRKAVTAAAAASLTMLAGGAGIALNSGIVGVNGDDSVGQLSPVSTPGEPVTVYVDDSTVPAVGSAPAVRPTESTPVTTSSASSYAGDDDGPEFEDAEHESDEGFEGADDDD